MLLKGWPINGRFYLSFGSFVKGVVKILKFKFEH